MNYSNLFFILITSLFLSACGTTRKYTLQDSPIESAPNVVLYENVGEDLGPCEPSVAINPQNTDMMVVGSVLNFVHRSMDGGYTWTTRTLSSDLGVFGDPCVVSDYKGNFHYFHLGDPSQKGWKGDRILESIVVQSSNTNGLTWSEGVAIGKNPPKQQDKEWAAVNPETNDIYVTWTEFDDYGSEAEDCKTRILFSKSQDGGTTWSEPVQVSEHEGNCIDDDNTVEGVVPSVGANGEIYIAYAYANKIYFDRSLDGGDTWLDEDIIVADQEAGWSFNIEGLGRCNGMPVTAVDRSKGPHADRIYINYGDVRNDNADIYLCWSDDGGKTWSDPKVIHKKTKNDQFLPWMDVDPIDGQVYIVYYDRAEREDLSFDVSLAYSSDGGESFTEKIISEEASRAPGKDVFFGDYNNIDVLNGKIRPVWTHYNGKKLSVRMALIDRMPIK